MISKNPLYCYDKYIQKKAYYTRRLLMNTFPADFLFGAATAAHQVEGNNTNSDFWVMEQIPGSDFTEPSLDAVDHYHHYPEDIRLLAEAGLNAYRFSIEWARIEPEPGRFDPDAVEHYRKMLSCCHENGVTPIVTLHHFSSPKWLISRGGWEWEGIEEVFPRYCAYVAEQLGEQMGYVCTINEANMGQQIAKVAQSVLHHMGVPLQVGLDFNDIMTKFLPPDRLESKRKTARAFGLDDPGEIHDFLSFRTKEGNDRMLRAHAAARKKMKEIYPHLKAGMTLSLYDIQAMPGGEEKAAQEWNEDFGTYLPVLREDDFVGVQNYTRKRIGAEGELPVPEGAELTQMGYEFYPQGIEHVVRRVASELPGKELIVTENGIAASDDTRREAYILEAIKGLSRCVTDGLPLKGYCYWSLLDNFEWQKGYAMTFGLIAVDRSTQTRIPKPSLTALGDIARCGKLSRK